MEDQFTRRWFLRALAVAPLATLPMGCGDPQSAAAATHRSKVSSGSFDIGLPDKYRRNRVYTNFADSHGVYLVSGHKMLVALAAECTSDKHSTSVVRWEPEVGIFRCPICSAKYTRDGLNRGKSQTSRPLERCRIRASGKIYDRDTTLVVDPGKRFRQEDQEWSKHTSFFPLEEIVRSRDEKEKIRLENARIMEKPPLLRHKD
ncbi:hypothetical protein [Algisphaera agarilytica]|uniref:Rieske [2Fe-2S] domain-containing protein n=1 Tax=Algisphaera agarilytica TaxID=1385975 RepID=A0A7X0LLP7_9BACT|nr:hypothetical protein [Algisphaera agarilytica]MBB6430188.1 hypothetical protein [Algisphaera agarilytica]